MSFNGHLAENMIWSTYIQHKRYGTQTYRLHSSRLRNCKASGESIKTWMKDIGCHQPWLWNMSLVFFFPFRVKWSHGRNDSNKIRIKIHIHNLTSTLSRKDEQTSMLDKYALSSLLATGYRNLGYHILPSQCFYTFSPSIAPTFKWNKSYCLNIEVSRT